MLGWFYGYRKPMIDSASRRCWFSKAYFRFASAHSQRPAGAGRVTRGRGSLGKSEKKTGISVVEMTSSGFATNLWPDNHNVCVPSLCAQTASFHP